ncbi:hypothetical protein ACB094_04G011300 [Castanea mollissima]
MTLSFGACFSCFFSNFEFFILAKIYFFEKNPDPYSHKPIIKLRNPFLKAHEYPTHTHEHTHSTQLFVLICEIRERDSGGGGQRVHNGARRLHHVDHAVAALRFCSLRFPLCRVLHKQLFVLI